MSKDPSVNSFFSILSVATVIRVETGTAVVLLDDEEIEAFSAPGCLDPMSGDRVLLVRIPEGEAVIANILTRNRTEPWTQAFPEGLTVRVAGAPLSVRSEEGISLQTDRLDVACVTARMAVRALDLVGTALSFVAGRVETVARTVSTVAERISMRSRTSTRETETLDYAKSGQTIRKTNSLYEIRSKSVLVKSRDLVKVDSGNIHLG